MKRGKNYMELDRGFLAWGQECPEKTVNKI